MILCPNRHENLSGLNHCKVCGLPLVDLAKDFSYLSECLASRGQMGRPLPHNLLIGLGTVSANLVDIAKTTETGSHTELEYLAIDTNGTTPQPYYSNLLRLTLGSSIPSAATFCGIGESLVRSDPTISSVLRKAGISREDGGQSVYLLAAVGGGIASAASVVFEKCRQLNPLCNLVGLLIVPGIEESFHNKLNAYYGLSCLLETDTGHAADLIVAINFDRIRKLGGVGHNGEKLKTESLLVTMNELIIKNLSSQKITDIVRINKSMGISVLVPCLALGRSLEIFGNLGNILESAIAFPVNSISKSSVSVCHLLLRVSENRTHDFGEEKVNEELLRLVKRHLPSVKSTSMSITNTHELHDRVDVCILLGGDSATRVLFSDDTSLTAFQEQLLGQSSWQAYGLSEENIKQANQTLAQYDFTLGKMKGSRRKNRLETKKNATEPKEKTCNNSID